MKWHSSGHSWSTSSHLSSLLHEFFFLSSAYSSLIPSAVIPSVIPSVMIPLLSPLTTVSTELSPQGPQQELTPRIAPASLFLHWNTDNPFWSSPPPNSSSCVSLTSLSIHLFIPPPFQYQGLIYPSTSQAGTQEPTASRVLSVQSRSTLLVMSFQNANPSILSST